MSEERTRILELLAQGKINTDEAARLLDALSAGAKPSTSPDGVIPRVAARHARYLRVMVDGGGGERVNVRVPLQLLRAGIKLAAVIPQHAQERMSEALREKGMNLDLKDIKPENLEEVITALGELTVDVQGQGGEQVRVFCE